MDPFPSVTVTSPVTAVSSSATFICTLILTQLAPSISLRLFVLDDMLRNNSAAETACKDLGYNGLAVLDRSATFSHAISMITLGAEQYWVGLHYSDKLSAHFWDTGFQLTWSAWNPGEPDYIPRDKCVRIKQNGLLGTYQCQAEFMALCGTYDKSARSTKFLWSDTAVTDMSSVLWTGTTRSLIDCVAQCDGDSRCHYVVFDSGQLQCSAVSEDLDIATGTQHVTGSQLGEKVIHYWDL